MKRDITIAVETDYNPFIPMIEIIRSCDIDENNEIIYSTGDLCLIKAITTSRAFMRDSTKNDLITHVKSSYFGKVYGCKFDVDLSLAEWDHSLSEA